MDNFIAASAAHRAIESDRQANWTVCIIIILFLPYHLSSSKFNERLGIDTIWLVTEISNAMILSTIR